MTRDSRSEYQKRMHRVLEYIDQNLDQPLTLEALAKVAHFSPFHFHRLFSAWMGETFGDYLRRRRVEQAAQRLIAQPNLSILQAALTVGFGSGEAFTRAFNARFGCSPTSWRKQQILQRRENRNSGQVDRNLSQEYEATFSEDSPLPTKPDLERTMNVKMIEREPATIAYVRHLGPYGETISRFWQEIYFPWAATNNLLAQPRYGISHDDPEITAPEQCRYDACAEVPANFKATGNAFKTTIPGGTYASLRFRGTGSQIGEAWTALLRDWLPASGLQLDTRPCFEYYPPEADCDGETGEFECDICIPVVQL